MKNELNRFFLLKDKNKIKKKKQTNIIYSATKKFEKIINKKHKQNTNYFKV